MGENTSNISSVVQHSINQESLTRVNNYLNKNKDILEPQHNLESAKYGQCIVNEYVQKDGAVFIIDFTDNKFRIYEIHPNGSYDAKLNDKTIQKSNTEFIHIINGDMNLKINSGGEFIINVGGGDSPVFERMVSFSKLKTVLESAVVNVQGTPTPITFVLPLVPDNLCYDKIKINNNA